MEKSQRSGENTKTLSINQAKVNEILFYQTRTNKKE